MGNFHASAQNSLRGYGQLHKRHLLRHASTSEDREDFKSVYIQLMFLFSSTYLLVLLAVFTYLYYPTLCEDLLLEVGS